jgi:hypothetical protein
MATLGPTLIVSSRSLPAATRAELQRCVPATSWRRAGRRSSPDAVLRDADQYGRPDAGGLRVGRRDRGPAPCHRRGTVTALRVPGPSGASSVVAHRRARRPRGRAGGGWPHRSAPHPAPGCAVLRSSRRGPGAVPRAAASAGGPAGRRADRPRAVVAGRRPRVLGADRGRPRARPGDRSAPRPAGRRHGRPDTVYRTSASGTTRLGLDRLDQRLLPLDRSYTSRAPARRDGVRRRLRRTCRPRGAAGRVASGTTPCTAVSRATATATHARRRDGGRHDPRGWHRRDGGARPGLRLRRAGPAVGPAGGLDFVGATTSRAGPRGDLSLARGRSSVLDDAVQALVDDGITVVVRRATTGGRRAGSRRPPSRPRSPWRRAVPRTACPRGPTAGRASTCSPPGAGIRSRLAQQRDGGADRCALEAAAPHVAGAAALVLERSHRCAGAGLGALRAAATPGVVAAAGSTTRTGC